MSQVPCKYNQSPPPQLLPKVIWMPGVIPQSLVKVGHHWFSQFFQFVVSSHKVMQLSVRVVGDNNTRDGANDCNEIREVQWLVDRVDNIQWETYSNQKYLQMSKQRKEKATHMS